MRDTLTPRQQDVLEYLRKKLEKTRRTPSLREAARDLEISHAAVAQTLKALEEKSYIRRNGRYSRSIHLLDRVGEKEMTHRLKPVPVIGTITAGLPMYAQQEWDGNLLVDAKIFPGKNLFALRIQGMSMKNAGILDQDFAVCAPRQYAENGEIIVALIHHEEATVKRFFLRENGIELRPENPEFSPRLYPFDDVMVQGRVIGIIRGPAGPEL